MQPTSTHRNGRFSPMGLYASTRVVWIKEPGAMEAGLTIRIRLALLYSGGMLYVSGRTWERRRYQNCQDC